MFTDLHMQVLGFVIVSMYKSCMSVFLNQQSAGSASL
jgi:hypothetical protein